MSWRKLTIHTRQKNDTVLPSLVDTNDRYSWEFFFVSCLKFYYPRRVHTNLGERIQRNFPKTILIFDCHTNHRHSTTPEQLDHHLCYISGLTTGDNFKFLAIFILASLRKFFNKSNNICI